MLDRVLEPEVMDCSQDAADYDRMDHSAVNRAFVADFLQAVARQHIRLDQGQVLDMGTGTAQIPIEFCRQSATGAIVAIDAAGGMLRLAAQNVMTAELQDRIELELQDAKRLSFPDERFIAVMSNSMVHHVPDPTFVFSESARVAASGGLLFFRDLFRPSSDSELARLVSAYAGQCNARQQALLADSLRAALTVDEVRDLIQSLGFAPAGVRATSDRHWTWIATRP